MARRRLISGPLGAGLALLVVLEAGAGAQDIEAGGRAVEEGGEADRGRLRHDVSPEYRSGAVPSEPIEVEGRFDRAEDHFSREEWAAGIAAIDEILAEATSPDHWRTARLRALRRRRAMERAARDRAARGEEGAGEGEGAAAAGADDRRAGRGPQRDDEEVSDDELVPTVEVYSRDGILYLPVAAAARERLAALPEEARQLYRRTYEAPAERALRSALDLPFAEAVAELRRIAERYPLTDAGTAARREWALRLADGGETLAAAHVLDEGLRSAAARFGPGERPVWLALSSLYHLLAGESREGRLRLETAAEDHSEAAVSVRGRAVLGAALPEHELFVQLEEAARERSTPPSPWPTALGGYARVAEEISPEMLPPLGTEARWIHSVREPLTPQARQRTATGSYPVLQAVAHGDLAIVRSGAKISAIDRRSGKLRWSADPGPPPAPEATSRINIISAVQQSADYFDQGGKALTVFRPSPGARALVVALDHSSPAAFSQSGKAEYSSNHLLAFDAESGKLRWKVSGRSAGGMDARGLAFTAPPAPAGGLLVAPATRDGGYYLVGIDASETDASVRWISRYYSFSTSYYIRYGSLIEQGSMVAASGGVVYFVPGHGLAGAAEAEGGRLLWLSRYRSRIRLGAGYNPYTGRGGWSNSHPILVRGEKRSWLVAAPRDSDYLTVFDPETGGVVWERTVDGGFSQLVGADRERVYVAGDSVRALAIESGDEVWTSESIGPGAGHGFAAAGRVYLPARGNIVAAIESASGEVVEKYTILDPRVSSEEPINLFPIGGELVALAGWGMAAIRSQSDSWDIVRGRESENLFRNARLLRGSGRHAEAIEILYRLIDEQPKGLLRTKLVKDLLETVSAAADATEDPRFVRELLERGAKLIGSEKARVEWRMREADLVAGSSPEEAAAVWLALLVEQGRTVHTPDGNDADAGIYASERLRELVFPREDADDEARALAERIRSSDAFRSEEEKTRKLLEDASSPAQRLRIAIRRSHAPSAAEAMLSLAADAAARGARDEAAALLDLFAEDYPGLREPEEIEQLRPDPGDAAPPGPVETFRLAELPPRAAAAPAGEGEERAAAAPSSDDAAPSAAAEGARASPARGVYREVFWHAIDEGVLAATAPGSDPLPAILAVRASKLRLIDRAGDIIVERELPGFPDLEEIKASLQSHIEEPFVAHLRDGILVLFTAGGCYAFAMDPPADGVEAVDAAAFRLRWLSPYPHALEKYRQSSRMGWGTISVESGSNLFPLVFFEGDGDPKILLAGGELLRIDRVTGKLVWRLAPETESQVIGDPSVEGGWRPLSRIEVASSAPPGLLRYTLPGEASGQRGKVELLRAPEAARRGAVIEGIARVFQGAKLVVASADGGRPLWSRAAGASLVRAESALVWTSVEGTLEARSLRSGRVRREIELPGRSRVVALFDDPRVDGGGWTIAATGGPGAVLSSYSSRAQTGSELHLIRLDAQKRKMWEVELASGPVTYDGSRLVLEDGRWLFALNEQERESEKWYTRVVAVSPEDGFVETWLTAKISGKGTGQPARLATAAGGIALGNSEGFGWFTTDGESMEEAAGGGDVR